MLVGTGHAVPWRRMHVHVCIQRVWIVDSVNVLVEVQCIDECFLADELLDQEWNEVLTWTAQHSRLQIQVVGVAVSFHQRLGRRY